MQTLLCYSSVWLHPPSPKRIIKNTHYWIHNFKILFFRILTWALSSLLSPRGSWVFLSCDYFHFLYPSCCCQTCLHVTVYKSKMKNLLNWGPVPRLSLILFFPHSNWFLPPLFCFYIPLTEKSPVTFLNACCWSNSTELQEFSVCLNTYWLLRHNFLCNQQRLSWALKSAAITTYQFLKLG